MRNGKWYIVLARKLQLLRYARPKIGHLQKVNSQFSGFASLIAIGMHFEIFLSSTFAKCKFSCRDYIVILFLSVFVSNATQAQETINKEVRVVKPYEPTLSDAFKINMLPVTNDTIRLSTDIQYSIKPKSFQPVYTFRPLKPARMESEQISKLYHSYLELGFGNYVTPLGELSISNLRSRTLSIGAYLMHMSSYGKVKLANEKKVFGGYGDTDFVLYGKKAFKKAILSAEAGVKQDWVHFYGYNTEIDTSLSKDNIRQNYLDVFAGIKLQSSHLDSTHLNYKFQANYHYFKDRFRNQQNEIYFLTRFNKVFLRNKMFGIDLDLLYIGSDMDSLSSPSTYIRFEPWVSQKTDVWTLDLALNVTFAVENGHTKAYLYPKAKFQFNIVPQYLTAYVALDGEFENFSFRQTVSVNPFQIPGLNAKSANRKLNFFGGFNGSFSRKSAYHIRGSYSQVDQMYFFVNDTVNELGNQFSFEYDDIEITRIYGEVSTQIGSQAELFIKANYYFYELTTQTRAWHKPNFDATMTLRYSFRNKILIGIDAFYIGKRYAKSYELAKPEIALDGFADINLKLEYQYTKILSFYLKFNNILGRGYEVWNQYPVQRFAVFGGFTYSL